MKILVFFIFYDKLSVVPAGICHDCTAKRLIYIPEYIRIIDKISRHIPEKSERNYKKKEEPIS